MHQRQRDAELLDACCAFFYGCAGLARINAMDDPTDEMIAPLVDAWAAPINTIIATPATTMAGVRAKAHAVIGFFEISHPALVRASVCSAKS